MEELDERLEAAYDAKTYADLVPLTADLPLGARPHLPVERRPADLAPAPSYENSLAIMGATARRGVWEAGPTHTAFALMGGVDIDLRQARFTSGETLIRAYAIWGGIDIYVNARTQVIVDGVGIMGAFEQSRDRVEAELGPDSPVVRVTGFALMAGVTVHRRAMPGTLRRRILGH